MMKCAKIEDEPKQVQENQLSQINWTFTMDKIGELNVRNPRKFKIHDTF